MDAYQKGLTGKQAVWGSCKYRCHRMIPESILIGLVFILLTLSLYIICTLRLVECFIVYLGPCMFSDQF